MEKSILPGFYKLSPQERLKIVKSLAGLSNEKGKDLVKTGSLSLERASAMVENVIGTLELPLGIATNFVINKKPILIPMAIEEPSIIAAASYGAKLALPGGFRASADKSIMKSMVQLVGVDDMEKAKSVVNENKEKLISMCRNPDSSLVKIGGGVFDIVPREIQTRRGKMLIVDILCDCKDAMGANTVNTAAEILAPKLEELTGGKRRLMIISNLADKRLARAEAIWTREALGKDVIEGILDAYEFADNDIHRASAHNKGIMNAIDAISLATGNDFRALESGAHSFASLNGYKPLARYEKTPEGHLKGSIELPLAVGIVGGSTKTNPVARASLDILGVKSSQELAEVMASAALAENLATLRAIVSEGLQKGHMKLHAKNLAIQAGSQGEETEEVAFELVSSGNVSASKAAEILEKLRQTNK